MKKILYLIIVITAFLSSCKKEDNFSNSKTANNYNATIVSQYYDVALEMTKKTSGFTPPVAARAFGYLGIALYESVVPGIENKTSLVNKINGFNSITKTKATEIYNWNVVVNASLSTFINKMYATAPIYLRIKIDSMRDANNTNFHTIVSDAEFVASVNFGIKIANDIFEYSKTDGQQFAYANNFPTYTIPTGLGFWIPTPPAYSKALQPYWGNVRTFLTANANLPVPVPSIPFSAIPSSAFYNQAMEVYNTTNNITTAQLDIANYWSDDPGKTATPSGHSISILNNLIKDKNMDLGKSAEAFAKMGIALNDAFICCWKCKYTSSLIRPISYIRQYINPAYNSLLITPPFPEFTSGHSVQSGAAKEILKNVFGNIAFTDYTHQNRTDINGSPRNFASFDAFAEEAAISRLYGGIHYKEAIEKGILEGESIGKNVANLNFNK